MPLKSVRDDCSRFRRIVELGGGVGLFVYKPSNLIPSQVNIPVKYDSIESVVLDICCAHHSKDVTRIILVYIPQMLIYQSILFIYWLSLSLTLLQLITGVVW